MTGRSRASRRWPSTATSCFTPTPPGSSPAGWTSKLGKSEDIEHDTPDVVAGGVYGEVDEFLKRSVEVV